MYQGSLGKAMWDLGVRALACLISEDGILSERLTKAYRFGGKFARLEQIGQEDDEGWQS